VIDYRISADQQVGLATAEQGDGKRWLLRKVAAAASSTGKIKDLARLATR